MNTNEHPLRRAEDHSCSDNVKEACASLESVEKRMEAKMNSELKAGTERMDRIEEKLDANCKDTAEVLDILRLGKSFFKVIGHFGALVKWVAIVGAPVMAFYFTLKNGGKP